MQRKNQPVLSARTPRDSSNILFIQPDNLTLKTAGYLKEIFTSKEYANKSIYVRNEVYELKDSLGQSTLAVKFKKTVARYSRKSIPDSDSQKPEHRWAVIGGKISKGGQGVVHEVLGTLYFDSNREIQYKSKMVVPLDITNSHQRVAKIATKLNRVIAANHLVDVLTYEQHLLSRLPDYAVKNIIDDEEVKFNILVSRRFKGEELCDYLVDKQITHERELLPILIGVFTELSALHAKNIIHGDIKLDNVLIDRLTKQIKLIDLGLARDASKNMLGTVVSGIFSALAPEILIYINLSAEEKLLYPIQPYSFASDIWALGRMIWLLFIGNNNPAIDHYWFSSDVEICCIRSGEMIDREDLFHFPGLDRYSDTFLAMIYNLLVRMNAFDPSERPTADECLAEITAFQNKNSLTDRADSRSIRSMDRSTKTSIGGLFGGYQPMHPSQRVTFGNPPTNASVNASASVSVSAVPACLHGRQSIAPSTPPSTTSSVVVSPSAGMSSVVSMAARAAAPEYVTTSSAISAATHSTVSTQTYPPGQVAPQQIILPTQGRRRR